MCLESKRQESRNASVDASEQKLGKPSKSNTAIVIIT